MTLERESPTFPADKGFPQASPALPGGAIDLQQARIDGLSVALTQEYWVVDLFVWDEDARTTRGVAIGDPLSYARRRYPDARCSEQQGEGPRPWTTCKVGIGNQILYFGEDPVAGIALEAIDPVRTRR